MPRPLLLLAMLPLACGHGDALRAGPSAESSPPPSESDDTAGPAPLSREEIVAGMQTALSRVRACPVEPRGSAPNIVRVKVAANGRVVEARTVGVMSVAPVASCIEQAIKLIGFRANRGTTFDYVFPPP